MALKEEAKEIVMKLIGPVNAEKVLGFDESNPQAFLDSCKGLLADVLGDAVAESNLKPLYDKYAS